MQKINWKYYGLILILLVTTIVFVGCGRNADSWVDEESGVLVRTGSPQAAVASFMDLLGNESYEAAALMLTKESQEVVTADTLQNAIRSSRTDTARLVDIIPGPVENGFGLVAHLRVNRFTDHPGTYGIFGIEILRETRGTWGIVRRFEELERTEREQVLEMLVAFEKELLEDEEAFAKLTEEQKENAMNQLQAMLGMHENALESLQAGFEFVPYEEGRRVVAEPEVEENEDK
ncbi:hypothetical protein [Dethiobacter alkaliphilus]|uniref:Uncharacterized protein n=1 Tax=Dethiobacter alkaliphilus AHT 1 TaxID=555088 RepID=C0GF33_DETAL|nr:hypothetical protein [Dethiobacter alkaliphilus]EEG78215.1 conserved hypothetical protein [Dethiobacter alkaliphilus AHT 1]